ncbi:hypothetical protein F66182_9598 [Fusarium sp. NRRL 66182]|nr:hypothetical protein F66182_9598 [Fusarium sp. NRRL 66182]
MLRGRLTPQPELPETLSPGHLTNDVPSPELETPDAMQTNGPVVDDFNSVISSIDASFDGLESFDVPLEDSSLELVQQPLTLTPPTTQEFGNLPASILNRLQWAIDEIQQAPKRMVLENQTPWCHALLYKDVMPRSMQESRINDLLSAPAPVTPLDCLAHTHALLLYQIIRLYDGDVGARASAERTIPAIEASAISLFSYAQFDLDWTSTALPLFPIAPTKTFWQDWILQESLRRTLLFTFYFVQIYRVMAGWKGLQCDGKLGLCHSWTLSAHLWNADTPLSFAEAWKDKKHYVVTNSVFSDVFLEAKADDIDSFGKIMISSLLGREEAEGWFASKGGKL